MFYTAFYSVSVNHFGQDGQHASLINKSVFPDGLQAKLFSQDFDTVTFLYLSRHIFKLSGVQGHLGPRLTMPSSFLCRNKLYFFLSPGRAYSISPHKCYYWWLSIIQLSAT